MRNPARMDVPEQFLRVHYAKDANPERTKAFEKWVMSKREKLKKAPAFDSEQEATTAAVNMLRKDQLSSPSVWREPKDVGRKHTVIRSENRENAYVAGYKETVNEQAIFDIANGRKADGIDTIEEV